MIAAAPRQRPPRRPTETPLDEASFRAIADLAYAESGLTLVPEKLTMVQSRLRHRLRILGITDFEDYCNLVRSDAGLDERRHLISALTTNVSHFFREKHHYERLADFVRKRLPRLREGAPLRIWSAGCSNGQEAISAAITILEAVPEAATFDLRILGTDIDPEVVGFARSGVYPQRLMGAVSAAQRTQFFKSHVTGTEEPSYRIAPAIRKLLRFNELNLLSDWPMSRKFDVIFCRNVVIYFDQPIQKQLWPRFREALLPDGLLFLGHSERIADPATFGFRTAGPTTYEPVLT